MGRKKQAAPAPAPVEEPVKKELGVFDFVNAINFTKEDLIRESDNPEAAEKVYNPFLANRALSYHVATLFDANMMNMSAHLDKQLQFDFLRALVRKEKRYGKWSKPLVDENMELVKEVYNCNYTRAKEILQLLKPEQLQALRDSRFTGGK